jgi:hypothetical protein
MMNLICTGGGTFLQRGSPAPTSLASSACAFFFLVQPRLFTCCSKGSGLGPVIYGAAVGSVFCRLVAIHRSHDGSGKAERPTVQETARPARIQTMGDSRRDGIDFMGGESSGSWNSGQGSAYELVARLLKQGGRNILGRVSARLAAHFDFGSRARTELYSLTTNHLVAGSSVAAGVVAWVQSVLQGGEGYPISHGGSSTYRAAAYSGLTAALRFPLEVSA